MAEGPALGFAGLLRQLRTKARLTQEELAEAAGLSPRSVSDLERGINRTAHKNTAVLLAGALGLAEPVVALAFIATLHAAATVPVGPQKLPQALVVAAVRADFLGRVIAYPPLRAALDAGPFTVGPMSEAELRLAITGPAAETSSGRGGHCRAARRDC
jgi:transcriptional regulator with XRE-family HTH domain